MAPLERTSQQVLDLLAAEPAGLTRNDLIRRTGFSRPTVFGAVQALIDDGVIEQFDEAVGGRRLVIGRPAGLVVGLDLGHDHLRTAAADLSGNLIGEIVERRLDVDRAGPGVLVEAAEFVAKALASAHGRIAEVRAIALGVPAPLNPKGEVVSNTALSGWGGVNIEAQMRRCLADRFEAPSLEIPVAVANDANVGALGEQLHGAAVGLRDFIYVKDSTGVGAGLVLDGRLHVGHSRAAGELGHVSVPREAEELIAASFPLVLPRENCTRCGRLDCLENLASCQAIVGQIKATKPSITDLDIGTVTERVRRPESPIEDPLFRAAVVNAGIRIGYCIADLVRVLDPEHVVLGGRLADARDVLRDTLADTLRAALKGTWAGEVRLVDRDRITRSEVEGAVALAVLQAMSSFSRVSHATRASSSAARSHSSSVGTSASRRKPSPASPK